MSLVGNMDLLMHGGVRGPRREKQDVQWIFTRPPLFCNHIVYSRGLCVGVQMHCIP